MEDGGLIGAAWQTVQKDASPETSQGPDQQIFDTGLREEEEEEEDGREGGRGGAPSRLAVICFPA